MAQKKGFKHTKETRELIGKLAKERHLIPKSAFKKGRIPWNKGKKGVMPRAWNYIDGRSKVSNTREMIKGKAISHIIWCKNNNIHRVPKGCVIHHIDNNSKNNSVRNLQLLEDRYHRSLHNQMSKINKKGKSDGN